MLKNKLIVAIVTTLFLSRELLGVAVYVPCDMGVQLNTAIFSQTSMKNFVIVNKSIMEINKMIIEYNKLLQDKEKLRANEYEQNAIYIQLLLESIESVKKWED